MHQSNSRTRNLHSSQSPKAKTAKSSPSSASKRQDANPSSGFSPKQMNAFAVNHLTARAHPSRPPPKIGDGKLPPNYKNVARKYTSAMVALPIAIVTSYMLWDRLALGNAQKHLVKDTPDESIQPVVIAAEKERSP